MWSSRSGAAVQCGCSRKELFGWGSESQIPGETIVTVLRADQTTGGTTGARPRGGADLCRLTILTPHSQIDLALPNSVPFELLVPGIADLVEKHSAANDFDVAGDRLHPTRWVLSRVGSPPLSPASTLQEHGVLDGELLVFDSVEASPPPPLFDDVMYNVAVADTGHAHPWTPRIARLTGLRDRRRRRHGRGVRAAPHRGRHRVGDRGRCRIRDGRGVPRRRSGGRPGVRRRGRGTHARRGGAPDRVRGRRPLRPRRRPATGHVARARHGRRLRGGGLRAAGVGHAVFTTAASVSLLGSLAALVAVLTEQRRGRSERCSSAGPCSDSSSHRGSR